MKYRAIVVDPPWPYPNGFGISRIPKQAQHDGRRTPLPYDSMTLSEIAALPLQDLADPSGCHLYLWTTNRYLRDAFGIMESWGFRYGQTLVWAKTPKEGTIGGAFCPSTEFVLFGRRGTLRHLQRQHTTWFNWPRQRGHSVKPEAFLDLVESVSPGPYLELFARRNRLGWDTWGNEALEHVELA